MAKQESVESLGLGKSVGPKTGWRGTLFSLLKFILSILLLPLVIGLSISFSRELMNQQRYILNNFVFAIVAYLILHIFIYEPHSFYNFGQKFFDGAFGFFAPLKIFLHYCLPFYSTLFLIIYFISKTTLGYGDILGYAVFLISFSCVMHLVLTAAHLKEESMGTLGGDYFFSLALVYLFEIIIISGFLKLMFRDNFSFLNFLKDGYAFFIDTHADIFKQLFVLK